jgi:hypothetical protein
VKDADRRSIPAGWRLQAPSLACRRPRDAPRAGVDGAGRGAGAPRWPPGTSLAPSAPLAHALSDLRQAGRLVA